MPDPDPDPDPEPEASPPRRGAIRAVVGVLLPMAFVLVGLGPLVAARATLASPLTTHWAADGQPNGTMSIWGFTVLVTAMTAVPGLVMFELSRRKSPARHEIAGAMGFCGFFACLWAAVSVVTVRANANLSPSSPSPSITVGQVALLVVAALAGGAASFALARMLESTASATPTRAYALPSVGLRPGERAQWVSTCHSTFAWPMTIGFGAAAIVFVGAGFVSGSVRLWWVSLGLFAVSMAGLGFTSIRVTADRRGLRIEYGPVGWPVSSVDLDDIASAHADPDAIPMQWGGWGYRGSLRLRGRAAIVLRRGPALRLDLVGGRTMLVTVDDPATGAGLLNDLHQRSSPSGPRT